jgi:TonB family protein
MQQLPGGGGNPAIVRAIQNKVRYPVLALRQNIQGRVLVSFLVKANEAVRNAKIIQGIGGGCDEEVLAVVRQLPNFTPSTQNGRPVTVGFTVPITFKIAVEVATDSILHVYTLVDQMPQLPGGGGNAAIARALQQALVVRCPQSGATQ